MSSVILHTFARLLVPLMLLFSLFLLVRGHNEPGGGFLGGLVAAAAIALLAMAESPEVARRALRLAPTSIALIGLGVAMFAGLSAAAVGAPFLTGLWAFLGADDGGNGLPLGTPLLFDVGVYLVVLGAVSAVLLALEEED